MSSPRSVKYRRLALVEPDQAKAQLLFQIADEADRGVLVTSERSYSRPVTISETSKDTRERSARRQRVNPHQLLSRVHGFSSLLP